MLKLRSLLTRLLSNDTLDKQILAALRERPKYGLEIRYETGCSFSSLYPALNRLEKQNLIGAYWDETPRPERGGARRRYYYLNDSASWHVLGSLPSISSEF